MRLRFFLFSITLLTSSVLATSYVMVPDDALADQARLVLVGTVERVENIVANPPFTRYYIRSERLLKGRLDGETVAVDVLGGVTPSGSRLVLMGNPSFAASQRLILFLVPTGTDSYGILHVDLGAFREQVMGNRRIARRNLAGSIEVRSRPADSASFHEPRDFDRFADWLQDYSAGSPRAIDYFVASSELEGSSTDSFSLGFFIARHDKFDKSETVEWVRNDGGQPNLPNGGDAELNAAFAAWNDDLNTNIDQILAGSVPGNPGFTLNGENNISYCDPDNDMPGAYSCTTGGALGRGGFFGNMVHTYGDQNYLTITEVNMVMNDGVDCEFTGDAAARAKAAEVYGHEIGHSLGLGHSCQTMPFCLDPVDDDALMRPNAHFDGRGARLGIDDRRGIEFLYPNFVENFARAIFPQYINGDIGGVPNSTRVVARNNGTQTDSGRINFQDADGNPQAVPVSISGSAPAGARTFVAFNIPAGGVFDIETAGTGALVSGSIEVTSNLGADSKLEATEAFSVLGNFVSVPSATLAAIQQVFVSVNDDENTGFAAYNPNPTAVDMNICMIDSNGNERADVNLSIDPRKQIAIFVNEAALFQTFLNSVNNNFTGTMNISTGNGEVLAILGLLQKAGSGALIAIETSTNAPHPEP